MNFTPLLFFTEIFYKYIVLCKAKDIKKIYGGKMKKIITLSVIFILICSVLTQNVFAKSTDMTQTKSWYIVKRVGSAPSFPPEAETVKKYGGIYLDERSAQLGNKYIYLTFDAGYENGNVARILDTLKAHNAGGAFFILENLITRNPSLVERMKNEGHLVCNHTAKHKDMTKLSEAEIERELCALEKLYREAFGCELAPFYRPPEGKFDRKSLGVAKKLGYHTAFWSLAYADWDNCKQPDPEKAKKLLSEHLHNGAVILLHPTSQTNADILDSLLTQWEKEGYRFGSLTEFTENKE